MPEVIPINNEVMDEPDMPYIAPVEMVINGFPIINSTGRPIPYQWHPPSAYMDVVMKAWKAAVREIYRLSSTEAPEDISFGYLYGQQLSGRIGDTFYIGAWMPTVPGAGGSVTWRRRFNERRHHLLVPMMLPMAMVEVNKTLVDTIDSW